jgi:hypothetical protein
MYGLRELGLQTLYVNITLSVQLLFSYINFSSRFVIIINYLYVCIDTILQLN